MLLFGFLLDLVEVINAVLCFVCSCLWHASHPIQFGAIEVTIFLYLGVLCINTLGTFLYIVGIITVVGIEGILIEFKDVCTHTIQEITIVCYH